jgi:hypothetical protein
MSHNVNELYPWEYYYDFPHPEFKHLHAREDKPTVQDTEPRVSISPDIVADIQALKKQVGELKETCAQLQKQLDEKAGDMSGTGTAKILSDDAYIDLANVLLDVTCVLIGIMFNGRDSWFTNNYECVTLLTLRYLYYRLFPNEKKMEFKFVETDKVNARHQMQYYLGFLKQLQAFQDHVASTSTYVSGDMKLKVTELINKTRESLKSRAQMVYDSKKDTFDNLPGSDTDAIMFEYLVKLFENRKTPGSF